MEAGVLPFLEGNRRVLGERGFAVLLFDKPGVNDSTGDWRRQSFDDRADEAVAAVRHLAFRGDIDPTRIGLMGHSQGGWIAQIARARSRDEVAFLILLSGLIGHAVGLFHGLSRTVAVLGAWYVFPDSRFVAIPAVIALIYLVSIVLLERRYAEVVARG